MKIAYEDLRKFAYTNEHLLTGTVRGICVEFFGLGVGTMIKTDPPRAAACAGEGILFVNPYLDPWAWMNRQAVETTDAILSALMSRYGTLPVVSTGGSMGGHAALIYGHFSSLRVVGCVANCPVCDLPYHAREREDTLRTLACAYYGEEDLDAALRARSPLHLARELPDIPYHIFHCCEDAAVNKAMHSDRLVPALRDAGRRVTYDEVPGCGHCALPPEMVERYNAYVFSLLA